MSDKPSSDKPLYDELMNLVIEIGELEVENRQLKEEVAINKKSVEALKGAIDLYGVKSNEYGLKIRYLEKAWIDSKAQSLTQELLSRDLQRKINDAKFKARLRYLFTRKL